MPGEMENLVIILRKLCNLEGNFAFWRKIVSSLRCGVVGWVFFFGGGGKNALRFSHENLTIEGIFDDIPRKCCPPTQEAIEYVCSHSKTGSIPGC